MNLSPAPQEHDEQEEERRVGGGSSQASNIEKENMFDKVVTPSDVGKLNRLVIPKQHAERYFPLDSSSDEKGLLLDFEDRTGKSWRFRYSYWNSSQSYVMTKGWSRFVKDKKLNAGDIVSFQRGVGKIGKDSFFIDWRRQPKVPADPTNIAHFAGTIFPRFYTIPQPFTTSRTSEDFHSFNHGSYNLTYHHRHNHYQVPRDLAHGHGDSTGRYYVRSLENNSTAAAVHVAETVVIDSLPVIKYGRAQQVAGKRLRLFGVDMDCLNASSTEEYSSPGEYMPRGMMGTASSSSFSSTMEAADDQFSKKGKCTLSFHLDR